MEPYTYTDAFEELQAIVAQMEQGNISIDELSEKVKRASVLIGLCKSKLTETEADVNVILKSLNAESADENREEE